MKPTLITQQILRKSITAPLSALGVTPNNVVDKFVQGIAETKQRDYDYRRGTNFFFDISSWIGMPRTEATYELLGQLRPTIRECIDFYFHPRFTTMGQFPFQTLFLKCEWDRYGLTKQMAEDMEDDLRRESGLFAHSMLIDTINMVMTGSRDIPIPILVSYMDNGISNANTIVSERFCRDELRTLTTEQFLTKWTSTENGMRDFVEMHRLTFNINF